ncbi:ATP-dependent DNA helicase RecG [Paraferrimonas sedimenticola]|uniref:ATP-dependent DNA helicase RecG n=1 Tax=Paraferrimonas sedimenticola TaxID=375674 RepID=A0AA37VXQ0_9GAMM|nr:ATP-dependent DNA helicase RecG [Paraferrimonas sedimenticola]GLP95380.1 ATP-dependent DNA helicase RecG [Paraferrimonas sedimenticola]
MQQLDKLAVTELKGVGQKLAEKLEKLGISSVQDLLFHLPLRYQDRTRITPIIDCLPGSHTCVQGAIISSNISYGRKRMLTVQIEDAGARMTLRFFNFSMAQRDGLKNGLNIAAFGEIRRGMKGLEIIHPEYRLLKDDGPQTLEDSLTPIYPTTEGLKQLSLRKLTDQALDKLSDKNLSEWLPKHEQPNSLSLADAVRLLHRPPPDVSLEALEQGTHPAQHRLVLEELAAHSLSMLTLRQQGQIQQSPPLPVDNSLTQKLLDQLSFSPTGAQQRVVKEINQDLAKPHPMMRLVQGDVGSGKTLVAALAALTCIANGMQVALMAPTELLAEQHANNFRAWFESMGIEIAWLAGKLKGKARAASLEKIASGEAAMIVGTHAIFQDQVAFKQLGLIIIDEQHRFGVHQRLSLLDKGANGGLVPHQLIMTATPIPRTLAMTAYADLDTSIIDELPPGRTPVTTVAIPNSRREQVMERVKKAVTQDGRQVYWVCTLIDESEVLSAQAAEEAHQSLCESLPELSIGLVHGRMKPADKQTVMDQFKSGELNLLVATTVIEVGVDVPNASLMIIENPERLGLAQLHQLRGRVGRGSVASHCVLLYQPPLSHTATKRLGVLRDSNDGFVIAQKDLEIRGPGEVLGTKQTGLADMKVADLVRDQVLIPDAQHLAQRLYQEYPESVGPLMQRWLGNRQIYRQA